MPNKKQRIKNSKTAADLKAKVVPPSICPNCKKPGAHYVPPSFGESGFFHCKKVED